MNIFFNWLKEISPNAEVFVSILFLMASLVVGMAALIVTGFLHCCIHGFTKAALIQYLNKGKGVVKLCLLGIFLALVAVFTGIIFMPIFL